MIWWISLELTWRRDEFIGRVAAIQSLMEAPLTTTNSSQIPRIRGFSPDPHSPSALANANFLTCGEGDC